MPGMVVFSRVSRTVSVAVAAADLLSVHQGATASFPDDAIGGLCSTQPPASEALPTPHQKGASGVAWNRSIH